MRGLGEVASEEGVIICTLRDVKKRSKLREAILKKSCFISDIVQKGGGVKPESKSFGVVFFWDFFWTFSIEGGGLNPFQKFLVVFR